MRDDDQILSHLALEQIGASREDKALVLKFFNLLLAEGNKVAPQDPRNVEIQWRAMSSHHWAILEVIKMIRDKEIQSLHPEGGSKVQRLFQQFLYAPVEPGKTYHTATICCNNEELSILITVLFGLWSGGISYAFPSHSPLKFDRQEFEQDVVKGFLSRIKAVVH
jgi:hypothetical protein